MQSKSDKTMTNETVLANARLVLQDEVILGAVKVKDGQIADISMGAAVPAGAVDCQNDLVIPGLIELHTDNLERHIQPRPGVDWPHSAAMIAHDAELASVGITTVFDAMRVGSVPSGSGGYKKYARQLSRELLGLRDKNALRISHYLHLRAEICSETLIEELDEFTDEDRVGIVSLMDHTPGQRQFRDVSKLKAYVMGKHSMNDAQFAEHVERLRSLQQKNGERHEAAAVAAAGRYGAVLASHDDTTAGQVAVSAGHGIRLAEFPTTQEAAQACRDQGIAVMMGAPNLIRGGSHSGNVAASTLAEQDLLDIVSSDYVPAALLASALMLGNMWGDVARGISTVTTAPADATGLNDRGRIALLARGDLVRVTTVADTPVVRGVWVQGARVS